MQSTPESDILRSLEPRKGFRLFPRRRRSAPTVGAHPEAVSPMTPDASGWNEKKSHHVDLSERAANEYDSIYENANFSTGLYMRYELDVVDHAISTVNTRTKPKDRVALDLGCGTGRDAFHFNDRFSRVIGFDFSPKMLEVAEEHKQRQGIKNVDFINRDLDVDLLKGVPDNSVDFINSGFGMGSFVQNLDALLADVNRVLKPGGAFTVSFYNSDAIVNELKNLQWTPSISARINPSKETLSVNFDGDEFDIAAKAYSMQQAHAVVGEHLNVAEVASFPTLSAILPNSVFENERMKRLSQQVDYAVRLDENLAGGPYITVIATKKAAK